MPGLLDYLLNYPSGAGQAPEPASSPLHSMFGGLLYPPVFAPAQPTQLASRATGDELPSIMLGNVGPIFHPPQWIGNRNYGPMFDAADQAMETERRTGRMQGLKMNGQDRLTPDRELNPKYVPDSRGISPTGWNRVA